MIIVIVAAALLLSVVSSAFGQTAPIPEPAAAGSAGLLPRSAFSVSFAGMLVDDPRFEFDQRTRADVDLVGYRRGRVNLLMDTELVMGGERRAFDLNHVNVIIETSSSFGLGGVDLAAVFHHASRHVVDRESDVVPAWHTLGMRARRSFAMHRSRVDVALEYGRVVQHTFVDYTWTSQGTAGLDLMLRPRAHAFASGRAGLVGVDAAAPGRGRQTGARVEGGVRLVAQRGTIELFAAYERRVDGHPTSSEPSSWSELGFRLQGP